jgi:PAS domain S-box-containing protein
MKARRLTDNTKISVLLRRAEERLQHELKFRRDSDLNLQNLQRELQVYHDALEFQNTDLELALARYKHLYDEAPVGYMSLNNLGMVLNCNLTGASLFGIDREMLIGSSLTPYYIEPERFQNYLAKVIQNEGNHLIELEISFTDGSLRYVQLESRREKQTKKLHIINTILTDISIRKHLEKELKIQQDDLSLMHQQQVAIHTASAIVHEINQPLTAISMYCEVATKYLKDNKVKAELLYAALSGCVQQAQRGGQSIYHLLEYLHGSKKITESFDLRTVIKDACTISQNNWQVSFNSILEFEIDLPPVKGCSMQIQKVVITLFQNSLEAMKGAGIKMPTITTSVRSLEKGDMVMVSVRDNGPGVEKETAQRIFDPFYSTKSIGIGLGLTIGRSLIEANGGQLWLDNATDENIGSVFHFTLPLAHAHS